MTAFIVVGRFLEARAKRRSGAALRALLSLGVKDVTVLRDRHEVRVPVEDLAVGDLFVVRSGEKIADDGIIESGTSAWTSPCSPANPCPPRRPLARQ